MGKAFFHRHNQSIVLAAIPGTVHSLSRAAVSSDQASCGTRLVCQIGDAEAENVPDTAMNIACADGEIRRELSIDTHSDGVVIRGFKRTRHLDAILERAGKVFS